MLRVPLTALNKECNIWNYILKIKGNTVSWVDGILYTIMMFHPIIDDFNYTIINVWKNMMVGHGIYVNISEFKIYVIKG